MTIVAKTKGSRARAVDWVSRWVPEREGVQREHEAIEREWNQEAQARNMELSDGEREWAKRVRRSLPRPASSPPNARTVVTVDQPLALHQLPLSRA
jgi:chemotaxis regulatin CheY-phosphate phosphatase CheZ